MNPQTQEEVLKNGAPFYQNYVFTTDLSATDKEVSAAGIAVDANSATAEAVK